MKLIETQQQQSKNNPEITKLIAACYQKPFYRWKNGSKIHEETRKRFENMCCFNHIIGLPKKGDKGKEYPLFDYEKLLFDALEIPNFLNSTPTNSSQPLYPHKVNHLAVLKASGLGLTEFFLRYIAWICMKDNKLEGSDIIILTGPRIELSTDLIGRLKKLFLHFGINFESKETTLFLNGVRISAFPSNHLSAARGLASVSMVFCDEAAFFGRESQSEVIDVCERYAGKSQAKIVLLSTANRPGDLMDIVLSQPFEKSFYKICKLDYNWGVNKIYTEEDIKIAKASSSFQREYNLAFAGVKGNVISSTAIDRCIELGEEMSFTSTLDDWNINCKYVISLDPSWGSSNFAILVSRFINEKVQIIYAEEFPRPDFQDIISEIWRLKNKCASVQNIIVDAANTEIYTALCNEFNQNPSLQYLSDKQAWTKKVNQYLENYLFICPVPFSTKGQEMLSHCKWLIEERDENGAAMVAIDKRFDKLLTSLRTAQATENRLDKNETVHDDLFDGLRLNLSFYRRAKE